MDRPLSEFIRALRRAGVRISTAETLDAFNAVQLVGYRDRTLLKDSLGLALPKTPDETDIFEATFEQFFRFDEVQGQPPQGGGDPGDREDDGAADGDGDGGGGGGAEDRQHNAEAGAEQGDGKGQPGQPSGEGDPTDGETGGALPPGALAEARSALGQMLMEGDRNRMALATAEAGRAVDLQDIRIFTQKGLYARRMLEQMGLADLNAEIRDLEGGPGLDERRLGRELERRRDAFREQVRDYVERQFLLHADAEGKELREEMLKRVKLGNLEPRSFRHVQELVRKMAKKLVALHSKKRKVTKRGQLHVPRTLRANMAYDGTIFDLRWKATTIDRPKVMAICDVSGSVASYARFMLMFLYSLEEVLPRVRSFAFSSDLGEVTDLFRRHDLDEASRRTLRDYGGGSTDYGQALVDFRRQCLDDVDNRTTVIILGDGRNNYGDPKVEILREVYDRARRVIWLNPEPPMSWTLGDAEIRRYQSAVHQMEECNTVVHLERVVSNILATAR